MPCTGGIVEGAAYTSAPARRGQSRPGFLGFLRCISQMAIFIALLSAASGTPAATPAEDARKGSGQPLKGAAVVLTGCDDLSASGWTELQGRVEVAAPLFCEGSPKVIKLAEHVDELILFSRHVIRTKGVRFLVREGATLTFDAPACDLEAGGGNTDGIIDAAGAVVFESSGSTDRQPPVDAIVEDIHAMLRTGPFAEVSVMDGSAMRFTSASLSVFPKADGSGINTSAPNRPKQQQQQMKKSVIDANRERATAKDFDSLQHREIFSCEDLDPRKITVVGAVYFGGDIVCTEPRVIEVAERTDVLVISDRPTLRIRGVRFVVAKNATMHINVDSMVVEAIEGDSSSRELFTVESDGYLQVHAEQEGPLLKDGTEDDYHSVVRVEKGGEIEFKGEAQYTASSVAVTRATIHASSASSTSSENVVNTDENSADADAQEAGDLPSRTIWSCDDLDVGRTSVEGMVIFAGDVVCEQERIVEVRNGAEATLLSNEHVLRVEGVRFFVGKASTMHFGVNTMVVEAVKGDSGSGELFTVHSGGHLTFHAEKQGPLPEDGNEEDTHSVIRVDEGGRFDVTGYVEYTESGVTLTLAKYAENPEWMRLHRARRHRERQHRQQHQQQQHHHRHQAGTNSGGTATVMPWVYRPFSPQASRESTSSQRRHQSPARIEVGEELRYPCTMTSIYGGSVLSLGMDGSLLIAPEARAKWIEATVEEAITVTTTVLLDRMLVNRHLNKELLWSLLGEIDEVDEIRVKTLAGPSAHAVLALLRRKFSAMEGRDRERSTGVGATSSAAGAAVTALEAASASPSSQPHAGHPGTSTGRPSGVGESPPPPPSQEWGDDVVLRITTTGSLVVTVEGHLMVEVENPHITKPWRFMPFKGFFRRLRRRLSRGGKGRGENGGDNNGVDDGGSAIVSDGYALHAVENGFEVRLDGKFVWGRYVS